MSLNSSWPRLQYLGAWERLSAVAKASWHVQDSSGFRSVPVNWYPFLSRVQENTSDGGSTMSLPYFLRKGLLFHLPVYLSSSCLCPSSKMRILALSYLKTGTGQGTAVKQRTGTYTKCKLYCFNSLHHSYSVEKFFRIQRLTYVRNLTDFSKFDNRTFVNCKIYESVKNICSE